MKEHSFSVAGIKCVLEKKGWIDLPASGVSMYPLIKEGDICRIKPLDHPQDLKKGDIILYVTDQGQLVGHRFCYSYVEGDVHYHVFKGDTNAQSDPPVLGGQLIGKLTRIKKRSFYLALEGSMARCWGTVVLAVPILPIYCKKYLYYKRKLRIWGKEHHHA